MVELPEYRALADMPSYPPSDFASLCPKLSPLGLELLEALLRYNPARRITAKEAMKHPYFEDLPQEVKARCVPP